MKANIRQFTKAQTWIWAVIGSIVLWAALGVVSGRPNVESLMANAYTAAFLGICAFGQMLVITSGRGAIDLSVPGVLTLAAYISMGTIAGQNGNIPLALLLVVLVGVAVGMCNAILIIYLQIPPIIATMAMNYILTTVALLYNRGFSLLNVAPLLVSLTRFRVFGVIPLLVVLVILLGAGMWFLLHKLAYGRLLMATGQNLAAAHYAGVRTKRVELLTYVLCSVFAAIAGMLVSARVGGAFLGMGSNYMMEAVGACVVGGTLISGGRAVTSGTLAGCLFLTLIITALQVGGATVGVQNVVKGLLIILVLTFSSGKERTG